LEKIQPGFYDEVANSYQEPKFGAIVEEKAIVTSPARGSISVLESMRNSMNLLTFGKDKPVFDQTTLNRFVDLFTDYKEKNTFNSEFYLDLSKEIAIEKYNI
jgi:hypothetical protein